MKGEQTPLAAACYDVVRFYRSNRGGVLALRGLDATFPQGTLTAIVGPSGAGKSTLLRLLAGIDVPDAGRVVFGDIDLATLSGRGRRAFVKREVGYVFQRPSQNVMRSYTVREHFDLAARLCGGTSQRSADEVARRLGLDERMSSVADSLSFSRRQQLAVGLALVGGASVIIADEPTAELDEVGAELLVRTLLDAASMGATFVVASHDPTLVDASDQVIAISDGAISARRIRSGADRAVIDQRGRLQLPVWALEHFPDREAAVSLDAATSRVVLGR